jgi:hypothetical protein
MIQSDDNNETTVPYQQLVDHFNRPSDSPGDQFDPDELPEGAPRKLYDTVMAEYYSHIPAYPAKSPKEKMKFDLINRAREHIDNLAASGQQSGVRTAEVLGTIENKQLTRKEIQKIVGAYRTFRPTKPTSTRP